MAHSEPPDVFSDDAGLSSLHDVLRLFCDPCEEDGDFCDAEGYCVDCTHHLCKTCFQHHRLPKPMRKHKLLDKQQMPQTKPDKVFKDEFTDKCSVHWDKTLKYFCEDHKKFGCTVCMTLEHRTCKVGYIPTLAADLFNTREYKSFEIAIETMVLNTSSIQDTATCNLEEANRNAEIELMKIQQIRKELDGFFDELANGISSKLTQIRDVNQKTIAEIIIGNKIVADKIKTIKKEMKDKEDKVQKCRLFVDMKQLDERIRELNKDIDRMEKNNRIQKVTFKPSASVLSFIRNKSETFGSLVGFNYSSRLYFAD